MNKKLKIEKAKLLVLPAWVETLIQIEDGLNLGPHC